MTMTSTVDSPPNLALQWGNDHVLLTFAWSDSAAVSLSAVAINGMPSQPVYLTPAVEVLTATHGRIPASGRLAHTEIGSLLRYVEHHESSDGAVRTLAILQRYEDLDVRLELEMRRDVSAVRSRVIVTNAGTAPVVLRAVPSWTAGFTAPSGDSDSLEGWERVTGVSDWLGEGRWSQVSLRDVDFVQLSEHLTRQNPRGAFSASSDGTWSSGHHLPTAALVSETRNVALAWQIEHNGAWRWEIGEDTRGAYLSLSGPTDIDSGWSKVLEPAQSFPSVPVTVAYGSSLADAVAALTGHRRATRRAHVDNDDMPVVFNDYMNTLDGDPTTEKLLPLIAAAAEVGAEVFCIDAGWYDDSGHWWDTVGEWRPSHTRFPNGLAEVIDAIQAEGMVPGLWLEPEVVGTRSPIAGILPDEAFLQRNGQRIVEHHRYHLDLRHPAARAHLDEVIDRLVNDFGVGFFKLDYNINPGSGTDHSSDSVGDGLLEHNRAHLTWLDRVLDRHPALIIENCSSGAMRMDYALLSRVAMQSTSDQQDFEKYPPIAAAAPLSMTPEQAASWAYPQPSMSEEEVAFCLVTGLLGRYYVSGHLNEMNDAQRAQVSSAIAVAKRLRQDIRRSHPHWPTGLPAWNDDWVSLGLRVPDGDLVSLWRRGPSPSTQLQFPHLLGHEIEVTTEFPQNLPEWRSDWDAATGTLTVHADGTQPAARTLRIALPSASRPAPRTH